MSTDRKTFSISIVLPVRNEADRLAAVLKPLVDGGSADVLVVDGGSTDASAAIAEKMGVPFVVTEAGRARQMNFGANKAGGEILLFVHGDTVVPRDFAAQINQAMREQGVVAGAFRLAIDAEGVGVRFVEQMANLRASLFSLPYGDQALFVRADVFRKMGGFPDIPVMEDFAFVRMLRQQGRIAILPSAVKTCGRRWQQLGVLRTTLTNQLMVLGFLLGISPERLARFYREGKQR